MARLLDSPFSKGFETLRVLANHPGFTEELGDAIRAKDGAERAIRALNREFFPAQDMQPVSRLWREENGVIYFYVTSDGTTGEDWIKRLEGNGFRVGNYAKQVLRSPDFKPTSGVTTEVAVLKGMLFENDDRITKNIHAEADRRKLSKPNAELACLIRLKFTDEEIEAMGLWYIVAMHEPVNDSDGGPSLLDASRVNGGCRLSACGGRPDGRWNRDDGFAFLSQQVS